MKSTRSGSAHRTWSIAAAIISMIAWLGLCADTAAAQTKTTTYSLAKDWNLKVEYPSPKGHNPLYFPGEVVVSDARGNREQTTPPAAKVTEQQATEIALRKVPGEVTSVSIERKGGKNVYVVEILAKEDGVETDVFVDIESGEVVGTDK